MDRAQYKPKSVVAEPNKCELFHVLTQYEPNAVEFEFFNFISTLNYTKEEECSSGVCFLVDNDYKWNFQATSAITPI